MLETSVTSTFLLDNLELLKLNHEPCNFYDNLLYHPTAEAIFVTHLRVLII